MMDKRRYLRKLVCESPAEDEGWDGPRTYGLATGYGTIKRLEGLVFSHVDDQTMEDLKGAFKSAGKDMDDLEETAIYDYMSGHGLREFIGGNREAGLETMASVVREVNGESIGDTMEERMDFVEVMPVGDGELIADLLQDIMTKVQEGRKKSVGKSGPSSEEGTMTAVVQSLQE